MYQAPYVSSFGGAAGASRDPLVATSTRGRWTVEEHAAQDGPEFVISDGGPTTVTLYGQGETGGTDKVPRPLLERLLDLITQRLDLAPQQVTTDYGPPFADMPDPCTALQTSLFTQLLGAPDNELPTEVRETEPNPFFAGNTTLTTQLNSRCNRERYPSDPAGEHHFSEVKLTAYANESDVPITMNLFLDPNSAVSKIGGDVSVRLLADFSPFALASPYPATTRASVRSCTSGTAGSRLILRSVATSGTCRRQTRLSFRRSSRRLSERSWRRSTGGGPPAPGGRCLLDLRGQLVGDPLRFVAAPGPGELGFIRDHSDDRHTTRNGERQVARVLTGIAREVQGLSSGDRGRFGGERRVSFVVAEGAGRLS